MLKKFISYYKNHQFLFYLDLLAALLSSGLNLIFPYILKNFVDDYIPNDQINKLLIFGVILLALYIVKMGFSYFMQYYGHIMGTRIERDMRVDIFKKYQTLDSSYFDENKTGTIMTHIVGHLRDISEMSHHVPENIFIIGILVIGTFSILFSMHIQLAFVILIFVIILFVFSFSCRKKMMKANRKTRTVHEKLNEETDNSIGGIRLTKAFTNEQYEIDNFTDVTYRYQHSYDDYYHQLAIFHSGSGFVIDFMLIGLLVIGGLFVYNGDLTNGEFAAFYLYTMFLIQPIKLIIGTIEQTQKGFSGFEKFYDIMSIEPSIQNIDNPIYLKNPEGKIEFKNVYFQYEQGYTHVLQNFNVTINKGEKVALVGETGVGKSTISKLIPRFYDVNKGEVLLDDINIKNYDLYSLRSNIGHVQQDVYIFYGTLKTNILYGRPDASDDDIIDAAKKANIHDFIMSLKDGYDTIVGERGVTLSGGQKQRISIARVFLKNPPILILDEATSSLDNITEKLIQNSLDELSTGRTTLVIAHRLSTISNANKILVLSNDGISEQGTHEELIARDGYYANLYHSMLKK